MSQAHSNTTPGGSPLEDKIAAAFAPDGVTSAGIISLIEEVEGAALASGKSAEHARERALDPALTANAVAEARREMGDSRFQCQRLHTAVSRLRDRLKESGARKKTSGGRSLTKGSRLNATRSPPS
jgi:hypothetical protein